MKTKYNPKQAMLEKQVVRAYNDIAGRNIKVLPREARIADALDSFELEDFIATFKWAQHDPWCVSNNILKTRPGWLTSYDVVAQHSDFEEPKGAESWT